MSQNNRPLVTGKKHAQIGAAQDLRHGRSRNARERHLAGHERQISQGAGHLNKIDIQIFFFVIAPLSGDEKSKLRDIVTRYRDPDDWPHC